MTIPLLIALDAWSRHEYPGPLVTDGVIATLAAAVYGSSRLLSAPAAMR